MSVILNRVFRILILAVFSVFLSSMLERTAFGQTTVSEAKLKATITRGLDALAAKQEARGNWSAQGDAYPSAMTGMAGVALLCEGSTSTQGKYSHNISEGVRYLISKSNSGPKNGLIGDRNDDRYTYGHGFGMLFLSQVLGEEEDLQTREELIEILTKAVEFTGKAQTKEGGWGYVSAADGSNFDEGSTTITQVQALRGCRNAGIPVPKEVIEKAIKYIHKCSINNGAGGVQYNIHGGGGRPPISAAAIACLFNAGEYDDKYVPNLLVYCDKNLANIGNSGGGYWHYAHYYYAQVKYRQGGKEWKDYRDKLFTRIVNEIGGDGSWSQDYIGPVYTSSINLTILQLEHSALPIYQK